VAATAPVPRPTHRLLDDGPTADDALAPPGSSSGPIPFSRALAGTATLLSLAVPDDGFTHRRSLRARSPFTRPCRSFCCAYAELIRDQTPPDDFCNCTTTCEQPNHLSGLQFSQGRWPRPPSFSSASRRSSLSSDTGRAALRPLLPIPVLVLPGYPGLPSRDTNRCAPPPPSCPGQCIVRIDEHGSKDRAKDASRFACDGVPCLRPVPTLMWRRTTSFPSSAIAFGHPLSPARSIPAEEAADTA
jgi:hypothetical protein